MRFAFHHVEDLPVSEECEHASFEHILEDKVLIVVTHLDDVSIDDIINGCLPFCELIGKIGKMINFFLAYISIKNFFVDTASQCRWNTSLGILYKEWLIVLLKKSLSNKNSFVDKTLLFIDSYLPESHIELIELSSQLIEASCL